MEDKQGVNEGTTVVWSIFTYILVFLVWHPRLDNSHVWAACRANEQGFKDLGITDHFLIFSFNDSRSFCRHTISLRPLFQILDMPHAK
jgi:hypothetical protein